MCYGNLDPKYAMRDIEARVKSLSFEKALKKQADPAPRQGLVARLVNAFRGLLRKDRVHV